MQVLSENEYTLTSPLNSRMESAYEAPSDPFANKYANELNGTSYLRNLPSPNGTLGYSLPGLNNFSCSAVDLTHDNPSTSNHQDHQAATSDVYAMPNFGSAYPEAEAITNPASTSDVYAMPNKSVKSIAQV